jgi:hypothetical protein
VERVRERDLDRILRAVEERQQVRWQARARVGQLRRIEQ